MNDCYSGTNHGMPSRFHAGYCCHHYDFPHALLCLRRGLHQPEIGPGDSHPQVGFHLPTTARSTGHAYLPLAIVGTPRLGRVSCHTIARGLTSTPFISMCGLQTFWAWPGLAGRGFATSTGTARRASTSNRLYVRRTPTPLVLRRICMPTGVRPPMVCKCGVGT
jgi:hypothetical protein